MHVQAISIDPTSGLRAKGQEDDKRDCKIVVLNAGGIVKRSMFYAYSRIKFNCSINTATK